MVKKSKSEGLLVLVQLKVRVHDWVITASGSDRNIQQPLTREVAFRIRSLPLAVLTHTGRILDLIRLTLTFNCTLLVLVSLLTCTSCQPASSRENLPVSARTLAEEYDRSRAAVRSKYDGKEITVRGYALTTATIPHDGDDQGSVLLEERERKLTRPVACWFSKDQVDQFSKIKGGQFITVKGIFNGEAGADLKFCKLVKIE